VVLLVAPLVVTGGRDDDDRHDQHGPTDTSPASLADLVGGLAEGVQDHDRELAAILAATRESLRALAWNRFAKQTSRRSAARSLRRRHQARERRHA
jgi:hypothetical protein